MVGQMLREKRMALGLKQEEVSEKIQVSRQTLSNWENEKTYPDIVSILKLSELYGVTTDELLKGDAKLVKHLDENTNVIKSNRRLIFAWALCPVVFLLANLLFGGIVIGNGMFAIHGRPFFWSLFLLLALSLISFVVTLVRLLRRRSAVGNAPLREVINRSDVLRLSMSGFFLVIVLLILWFLL